MLGIFTSGRTIRLVESNLLLLQTSLGGLRDEPRLPNVRALNILSVSGRCLWDQVRGSETTWETSARIQQG